MPRSAEETSTYYEGLNGKMEAERKAFWNSPVGDLKLIGGRFSDREGSIELLLEDECRLQAVFDDDEWLVGLRPLRVSDLWALPDGLHRFDFTINSGTKAARAFINRRRDFEKARGTD